ncbi:hypothetical protein TNCV_4212591 [Trichonephila clavipes]|nr:hypothetical protein TNCV_4212591 [Trichonephila clavipes]
MDRVTRHLGRVKGVARFRLPIGHDFLGVNLHWFGLDADEAGPLCNHAIIDGFREVPMLWTRFTLYSNALDSIHPLLQCTGLDSPSTPMHWT